MGPCGSSDVTPQAVARAAALKVQSVLVSCRVMGIQVMGVASASSPARRTRVSALIVAGIAWVVTTAWGLPVTHCAAVWCGVCGVSRSMVTRMASVYDSVVGNTVACC